MMITSDTHTHRGSDLSKFKDFRIMLRFTILNS